MNEKKGKRDEGFVVLTDFLKMLVQHNETGKGYQVQLNSGNLDSKSNKHTDVEFGDLYFTECTALNNIMALCFGNTGRKPVGKTEDGVALYPSEISSHMFIDVNKIEFIQDVKDFEDWFEMPSEKALNIYMRPENDDMDGCRNVVTVGFMK